MIDIQHLTLDELQGVETGEGLELLSWREVYTLSFEGRDSGERVWQLFLSFIDFQRSLLLLGCYICII